MMKILPIQVTDEGVLIPLEYLQNAREFEFELQDSCVLIRPKHPTEPLPDIHKRYPWIGMAHSKNPNASAEVEEILRRELGKKA